MSTTTKLLVAGGVAGGLYFLYRRGKKSNAAIGAPANVLQQLRTGALDVFHQVANSQQPTTTPASGAPDPSYLPADGGVPLTVPDQGYGVWKPPAQTQAPLRTQSARALFRQGITQPLF